MKRRERVKIEKTVAINDSMILAEGDEVIILKNVDDTPDETTEEVDAADETVDESETEEKTSVDESKTSAYRERFAKIRRERAKKAR